MYFSISWLDWLGFDHLMLERRFRILFKIEIGSDWPINKVAEGAYYSPVNVSQQEPIDSLKFQYQHTRLPQMKGKLNLDRLRTCLVPLTIKLG